jgi:undecaprenyl-diphosphatase
MPFDILKAAILGIVEGLTEFLPVSSTGHLLLLERFFGFDDDELGKTFVILIQLGAILGLLSIYFARLWKIAIGMFHDVAARRFVIGLLIAFLPAAVIGAVGYNFIRGVLFNPWIVCFMLILGGAILLWVDRLDLKPRYHDATAFPLPIYLLIGIFQCFSMIPGVSRSGATIVSAMLLGSAKRAAADFSFFLAIPTMTGAFAYALLQNYSQLEGGNNAIIVAVGFVASFLAAWIVVKTFLDYVSRHGFALFAWWRIIVGAAGLVALSFGL